MHRKEHVRRHAIKHHERHLRLKELLQREIPKERLWPIFATTFVVAMTSLALYANWGSLVDIFTQEPPKPVPQVHGFKTGMQASLKIDGQAEHQYRNLLASINTFGSTTGVTSTHLLGQRPGREPQVDFEKGIKKAVQATQALSTGQHLTKFDQNRARAFQKSVLTTYYIGRKSIDVNSTLQNDTQILTQINNTLSVDLFAYLNQTSNRSDGLDGYLNLLEVLLNKVNQRLIDLNNKIAFLTSNFNSQETQIKVSEESFMNNLRIFNGPNAEEELGRFIGMQSDNVETKAKIGAYTRLRDYYAFFQPRLSNLITAIRANRDPLIAGVKVVEIQNMTLPLIIRQQ